jgi:xanthine dehydrogenase accessory factor
MLASRRRGITLLAQLEEEGFCKERLDCIHTPIGLDINAITLEEIAVSIVAELVQERRAGTPRRSKSVELTQTDPEHEVLEFVEDPEPKALVVVVETLGSTPVKTGALLAVDQNLHSAGTIGGGCAESACMRQARQLIGTGEQKLFTVSLNEPDAEEQGMACGGTMRVLAMDLG